MLPANCLPGAAMLLVAVPHVRLITPVLVPVSRRLLRRPLVGLGHLPVRRQLGPAVRVLQAAHRM